MRIVSFCSWGIVLALTCWAAGSKASEPILTPEMRDGMLRQRERLWRSLAESDPPDSVSVRALFDHAFELAEYNCHWQRIDRLFELAERMQDQEDTAENPTYGNFRWYWRTPEVTDKNAVEFVCLHALPIWIEHRDRLSTQARARLERMLRRAIEGCLRHRVRPSYTNIALSNAANLILLGETFNRPDALDAGKQRLENVLVCTWRNGVVEYVSPTYYGVDLDELKFLDEYVRDPQVRRVVEVLLDLFWADLAANWYPASERLAGSQSRTYHYLLGKSEALDRHLRLVGWLPLDESVAPGASQFDAHLGSFDPSAKWWRQCRTEQPRVVRQRFREEPTHWRTLAVYRDVALGCSGAYYGRTDVPLAVDLPGSRELARCYFLADGREDPYGKKKFATGSAGHRKALHLDYDWLGVQRNEDALALVSYPPSALEDPLVTNLQSHFVFRVPDAVWIDGRQFDVPEGPHWHETLPSDAALTLRYGSATVGVRVPWSRDQHGHRASLTLARDDARWGVMRLTVEHRRGEQLIPPDQAKTEPAALLWVRVGHDMPSSADLAAWEHDFRVADARIALREDLAEFSIPGVSGDVSLRIEQPWTPRRYALTSPGPPAGILEVDGVEIGRALLERLPPFRAIAEIVESYQPEQVSEPGEHLWEAEDAIVLPSSVGDDSAASDGRYVTVQDEVRWHLQIPTAGTYYLWARIKADDPQHDSCYVGWTPGAAGRARHDWHMTRGKNWHWDRVRFGKSAEPAAIEWPQGMIELSFRMREPDARVDRLFITTDASAMPPEGNPPAGGAASSHP